jgi:pyruvate/2-oxoacid:ferredoxin oxidoreductase beta subunit
MDKFNLYAAQMLSFNEQFASKGHNACKGCGIALAVRQVYKALENIVVNIENAKWDIPWQQNETVGSNKDKSKLSLLTIEKENGETLEICFDNECSDNKIDNNNIIKRQPSIAAAGGCKYVATASPSHPFDLIDKIRSAYKSTGSAFVQILSPCPVAWDFDSENTVRLARIAVEARVFPLYEIADGYYRISAQENNPRTVKDYLNRQGRFSTWKKKKIEGLQDEVNNSYNNLIEKSSKGL